MNLRKFNAESGVIVGQPLKDEAFMTLCVPVVINEKLLIMPVELLLF
jgi:hypothetical protein